MIPSPITISFTHL